MDGPFGGSSVSALVIAVSRCPTHDIRKQPQEQVPLLAEKSVAGDAHCSENVMHRFDASQEPRTPNLRLSIFRAPACRCR